MSANRLLQKMRLLKIKKQKAFCAFLTLGFPNLKVTETLIQAFDKAGVDIVELGFPFSDPLADGPTIQFSSEAALKKGVTMNDAFRLVERLRKKGVKVPIIFFSYLNPIYHYGISRFPGKAIASGFDGLLIPDMPPEEERKLSLGCHQKGLPQIFLIAPTTKPERAAKIGHASTGFIYYVSLRGVTGARKALPGETRKHLSHLKRLVKKPLLVGFGVSTPGQAQSLKSVCEGVIVGSAIIDKIRRAHGATAPVIRYVEQMVRAVKGSVRF